MTHDVEMAARYAGADGGAYPPRHDDGGADQLDDDGKKRTGKYISHPAPPPFPLAFSPQIKLDDARGDEDDCLPWLPSAAVAARASILDVHGPAIDY
jgi:hypothetical protein